jgi:hypothetical protein
MPGGKEDHLVRMMTPPVATRILKAMKAPLTAQGPPELRTWTGGQAAKAALDGRAAQSSTPRTVWHEGRGTRVAANYEIRVKGRVGDAVLLAFEGLTVTTEPVETILYGPIPDQEALHELLAKLQSLGLEVVEFRRLPAPDPGYQPPA